jgi:hypothetical protein
VETISKNRAHDVAGKIANTIGKPDASDSLLKLLQVFESRKVDFMKKAIDKDYNGALRQIVYYSYLEGIGFVYFRFNFKMTSTGWILANFSFKDETNELFPKDFTDADDHNHRGHWRNGRSHRRHVAGRRASPGNQCQRRVPSRRQ